MIMIWKIVKVNPILCFNHYLFGCMPKYSMSPEDKNCVKPLPPSTVKLLGSFQVITSPATVVKELMENSFDAEASNIQIKLENYGVDSIQITDNGSGVLPSDASFMCRRNCTSKISDFNDLGKLESYGFRGEALNSICAVADVTITTKTKNEKLARRYTLNHDGEITSCQTIQSDVGTTVLVEKLFKNLPVRKQFLSTGKRKTDELKNVENIVKTLSIINHSVRVVLIHNKFVVWQKHGVHNIILSLVQMLSSALAKQLYEIDFCGNQMSFKLLVPKKDGDVKDTCYGNLGKTMYLFVNSRPVRVKPIEKAVYDVLNTYYQSAIPSGKLPTCLVSIILPPDAVDVNLEPNKTKVLLKNLEDVINCLKAEIEKYYFGELDSILNSQEHIEVASKRKPNDDFTKELAEAEPQAKCPKLDQNLVGPSEVSPEKSRDAIIAEFIDGLERPEGNISSAATVKSGNIAVASDLEKGPLQCENVEDVQEKGLSPEKDEYLRGFFQRMNALKNKEKVSHTNVEKPESSENITSINANNEKEQLEFTSSQWSRGEVFIRGNQLPSNVIIGSSAANELCDTSLNQTTSLIHTQDRSVSSQMGQKNMCGFTKFAREIRSQLIRESPRITFAKIARELASRWKGLNEDEKETYKEKALEEKEQKKKERAVMPKTVLSYSIDKHVKTTSRKTTTPVKKSYPEVVTTACSLTKIKSLMSKRVNYREAALYEVCTLNDDLVIVRERQEVAIFSRTRLSEAVKYQNALIHTIVSTQPLKTPIRLNTNNLGNDLIEVLHSLPVIVDVVLEGEQLVTRDLVSDDRLTRNGFIVSRICEDSAEYSIIKLPEEISLGIEDLKDLLKKILRNGSVSLTDSRPQKIINYIENQVLNGCSQSQLTEQTSYCMDLYRYWTEKVLSIHGILLTVRNIKERDCY